MRTVPPVCAVTACEDGEGAWSQETVTRARLTRLLKGVLESSNAMSLVYINDCLPSIQSDVVSKDATHIVLLVDSSDPDPDACDDLDPCDGWRQFAADRHIPVVAEVYVDDCRTQEEVWGLSSDGVLMGTLPCSQEQEEVRSLYFRPMILALADHLVKL